MLRNRKTNYDSRQSTPFGFEKVDVPTREEQYELARRIRENDKEAYHELIYRNMALAHFQASKLGDEFLSFADLNQAGYVGLCKAAKFYNPDKYKTAFSTYAVKIIKREMLDAIRASRFQVNIPNWVPRLIKKIKPEIERYKREGREIDTRELSKKHRVGEDTLKKILRLSESYSVRLFHNKNGRRQGIENSLDELVTCDGSVETERNRTENLRRSINEAYKRRKISDRDSRILAKRSGAGLNSVPFLEKLGAQEGISKERIRQIAEKTREKLRRDRVLRQEYVDG